MGRVRSPDKKASIDQKQQMRTRYEESGAHSTDHAKASAELDHAAAAQRSRRHMLRHEVDERLRGCPEAVPKRCAPQVQWVAGHLLCSSNDRLGTLSEWQLQHI